MWSFQDQKEQFSSLAQTDNADQLTLGYKNINVGQKKLEVDMGIPPMQEERTYSTSILTNIYPLPERFISLDELYVTDASGIRYYAEREFSEEAWGGLMKRGNTTRSNMLSHAFVRPGLHTFEIFPLPTTAGLTLTMIYSAFSKDLSANDYITGTITTLANGGTAVTGSGTTFTSAMAGRWLKINNEGNWYRIQSVASSTSLTLQMPYQGSAISAGSEAFTIGEIPRTPEGTHEIPVYYALWQHFAGPRRNPAMAKYYQNLWEEQKAWASEAFSKRYSSGVIPSQRAKLRRRFRDPNNPPDLSSLA